MPAEKIIDWKLHEKQEEIWNDESRYQILCAGRRGGKSELGTMLIGAKARDLARTNKNGVIWIVLPTREETKTIWRKFKNVIPREWITDKSGTEKRPDFFKMNNIIIQFRSADRPERLVAEGLRAVWLDEAGIMLKNNNIWQEYIRPTLIDYKAPAFFSGTPKGKNKFFELYIKGNDPQEKNYNSFHWASYENPFIPASEINKLALDMPKRIYQQEILAKFLDDSAAVFRGVDNIIGKYSEKETVVVGVDLAKAEDFTVLIGLDGDGAVTFFDRFNEISWPLQKKRIVSKASQTGAFFLIDSTGVGDPIVDDLKNEGVDCEGYKFTNASKAQLIEGLEIAIEGELIRIPKEQVLIDELKAFTYEVTRSGNMKYHAPEGLHDDCLKQGTLIKTIEGYKPIEEVSINDMVLTHKNRYRRVSKKLKKPFNGKWYNLKFRGQLSLGLSYNHPLYCARNSYSKDVEEYNNYKNREWKLPREWCKGYRQISLIEKLKDNQNKTLTKTEFYKRNKYASNNKINKIKLDKEFAKFLGLFLAEGHCGNMNKHDYRCSIAFNKNDRKLINEIKNYLSTFNIGIQEREYKNSAAFALTFSSKFLHHILSSCYDKKREKKLPYYGKYLGKDLKYVLEYWLIGDGWNPKDRNYICGATTSKTLGLSMRDIAFSIGKYATIQKVSRNRYEEKTKDQYWVYVKEQRRGQEYLRELSKYEYGAKIDKIKKERYKGYVYNLEVEEDRSFVANGIVVHNCVMALGLSWIAYKNNKAVKADDLLTVL